MQPDPMPEPRDLGLDPIGKNRREDGKRRRRFAPKPMDEWNFLDPTVYHR